VLVTCLWLHSHGGLKKPIATNAFAGGIIETDVDALYP